jgi:hypothetical protein
MPRRRRRVRPGDESIPERPDDDLLNGLCGGVAVLLCYTAAAIGSAWSEPTDLQDAMDLGATSPLTCEDSEPMPWMPPTHSAYVPDLETGHLAFPPSHETCRVTAKGLGASARLKSNGTRRRAGRTSQVEVLLRHALRSRQPTPAPSTSRTAASTSRRRGLLARMRNAHQSRGPSARRHTRTGAPPARAVNPREPTSPCAGEPARETRRHRPTAPDGTSVEALPHQPRRQPNQIRRTERATRIECALSAWKV